MSKGTLYAYFNSKEQLFEAIIREERRARPSGWCSRGTAGDARELLREFGIRLIEMMTRPELIAHLRVVIAATRQISAARPSLLRGGPLPRRDQAGGRTGEAARGRTARFRGRRRARGAPFRRPLSRPTSSTRCCSARSRPLPPEEIEELVDEAVDVFLRAYGAKTDADPPCHRPGG